MFITGTVPENLPKVSEVISKNLYNYILFLTKYALFSKIEQAWLFVQTKQGRPQNFG